MPSLAPASSTAASDTPAAQHQTTPSVQPQPEQKCVEAQAEGVSVLMETYPQVRGTSARTRVCVRVWARVCGRVRMNYGRVFVCLGPASMFGCA